MRRLAALALLPVLALGACSSSEDTSTPAPSPTTTAPQAAVPTPTTVVSGSVSTPESLSYSCESATTIGLTLLVSAWGLAEASRGASDSGTYYRGYRSKAREWAGDVTLDCPPRYAGYADQARTSADLLVRDDAGTYIAVDNIVRDIYTTMPGNDGGTDYEEIKD
jgi:hypothetical protein